MNMPQRVAAPGRPRRLSLLTAITRRPAVLFALSGVALALSGHGCSCSGGGDPIALPTLSFVAPEAGATLGSAEDLDLTAPGLQLDVQVQTTDLRAGALISLLVGAAEAPLEAPVAEGGLVVFEGVTLPQGGPVKLEAHTADGQIRTSVEVTVADWAFSLAFLSPAQAEVLSSEDDVDATTEGFQYDIRVGSEDLPAGTAVRLQVAGASGAPPAFLDELGRALFASVTLPPGGAVVLRVEADYRDLLLSDTVTVSVPDAPIAEPVVRFVDLDEGKLFGEADDADGDLLNGLQVNLTLATEHLRNGRPAQLWVGGVLNPLEAAVQGDAILFDNITLPEAPPGTEGVHLVVRVTDDLEREASAERTVFVNTGRCVVVLTPTPGDAGCDITEDPVPATPEIEATFTVESNCATATLFVNQASVGEQPLDGDGRTVFRGVPLTQGLNTVEVEAAGSGGRTGSLEGLRYDVDVVRPTLDFTEIAPPAAEPTLFVIADDLDRELEGVQIELRGWVTDVAPGRTLTLDIEQPDGEPLPDLPVVTVLEATDGQGRNLFVAWPITLPQSGTYELSVTGTDGCELTGSSSAYRIRADVIRPTLAILSPAPDSVLLAADDLDPEAAGFQAQVLVQAAHVPEGGPIEVRCGARDSVVRTTVGSALMPEGQAEVEVTVPVTLAEGWRACYASYAGANSADSEPVVFLVAGERPTVAFVAPVAARVNTPSVRVSVLTTRIADGRPVELLLNGEPYPEPMLVQGNGATLPAVALQPGANVLHVTVSDEAGNRAEAERRIVFDADPPVVVFLDPMDGAELGLADDLDRDPANGIQIDVLVGIGEIDETDTGTACLWIDGAPVADCDESPMIVAGLEGRVGEVVFAGVRLSQGLNTLRVVVVDGAGNSRADEAAVHLDIAAPTCEIRPVAEGDCLADGAGVRVVLNTDAQNGATAVLTIDGQDEPDVPVDGGQAVFSVDLPADADTVIEARILEPGRPASYCRARRVQVRTSPGTLNFVDPLDGAVLNASVPSTGYPGFRVDVRLQADMVMRGQLSQLEVRCGDGEPVTLEAAVEPDGHGGAELLFEQVPLLDLAACVLSVTSENCAGGVAEARAEISVDRVPPTVAFLFPLDGGTLSFRNDIDPAADGMQVFVRLAVHGVSEGTAVRLIVPGQDPYNATLEAGNEVGFPRVDVPDGVAVPLRAEVADPAGNTATAIILLGEVLSGQPSIALASPGGDTTWMARDDLDPATEGFQQEFRFVTAHLAEGVEVRLCSDTHDGEGVFCGRPGFQVLGQGTVRNDEVRVRRVTLLQGEHELYAEARFGAAERVASESLRLFLDATLPELLAFSVTSDEPPFGILNAEEDLAPGGDTLTASLRVAFVDDPDDPFDGIHDGSRVRLVTNNPAADTELARVAAQGGEALFPGVQLRQGTHRLRVLAWDAVSNPLAWDPGRDEIVLTVDTVAPSVVFQWPTEGGQFNALSDGDVQTEGLQINVTVQTAGAVGEWLALTANGGADQGAPAVAGALVLPNRTLPEGDVTLTATLSDPAGNEGSDSVSVTVDTQPPTVAIITPAPDTLYAADQDLQPERGGFQIDVQVSATGVPAGAAVTIVSDGMENVVSDPATLDEQGAALVRCTVPVGPQTLTALVSDAVGNNGSSEAVAISVEVVGCGIAFVAPAGSPVLLGLSDDNDPELDGCQIPVLLSVADLECDGLQLDLLRDGAEWAGVVVEGGQAAFAALSFADDTSVLLQGRMDDGQEVVFTEEKRITTDLTPPTGSFLRPAADPATLLVADDLRPDTEGLQMEVRLELEGTSEGRLRLSSDLDGLLIDLPNDQHPQVLADGTVVLPETLTLSNGEHQLTAELRDKAGNQGEVTITVRVDSIAPTLEDFTIRTEDEDGELHLRLPRVELSWTAPSDDGPGDERPVHAYDIRYFQEPIDEANFDAACAAPVDPVIALPGETQAVVLQGPGPMGDCRFRLEGTYYFAVRAYDALGNPSAVALRSAAAGGDPQPLDVHLQTAVFTDPAGTATGFGRAVSALGDVDGDDFPDTGIGSQADARAWILYGAADAAAAEVVEITPDPAPDFFGRPLAGLGDVSGDGIADFAVPDGSSVHLYLGSRDLRDALPVPTVVLTTDSGFAPNVAAAGNFDGVGPADLLVGDLGQGRSGAVWVILGRSPERWRDIGGAVTLGFDPEDFDTDGDGSQDIMAFTGTGSSWVSVASAGHFCDTEGPGDDVAVGAFGANGNAGEVFIVCSRPLEPRVVDLTVSAWRIPGPQGVGGFGLGLAGGVSVLHDRRVGAAEDLFDELIVSAPASKRFFVLPGGAQDVAELRAWMTEGLHVEVVTNLNQLGEFVATVGDVDGNGTEDIALSTSAAGDGAAPVYLNLGPDAPEGRPLPGADPLYTGTQGSSFGRSVAGPGDVNQDGHPDLVVGAPGTPEVHLFY